MPPFLVIKVSSCRMNSYPIILSNPRPSMIANLLSQSLETYPNDHAPWCVGSTDLEVGSFGNMVEQELEESFRLFLLQTHNVLGESLVDIECLFSSHGVDTNERVLHGKREQTYR